MTRQTGEYMQCALIKIQKSFVTVANIRGLSEYKECLHSASTNNCSIQKILLICNKKLQNNTLGYVQEEQFKTDRDYFICCWISRKNSFEQKEPSNMNI